MQEQDGKTTMDVYVMGVATYPATDAVRDLRLEELAYATARAALDDAGLARDRLDHVTLAGCDEIDARGISSMLLASPSGAYLKDENRVTDSGLTGLHLGVLRAASGHLGLGLVVSWSQSSVGPLENLARMRVEPFYMRPVGLNFAIADGLLAGAVAHRFGITEAEVAHRVLDRLAAAAKNERALRRARPTPEDINASALLAWPLRTGHRAPVTDGAAAVVLASGDWVRAHPRSRPLARITGIEWAVDSQTLGGERLTEFRVLRDTLRGLLARAGLAGVDDFDLVEYEAQTGWTDVAIERVLDAGPGMTLNPSGGAWAENPFFCRGLVNAIEAVLQVSGRAGTNQVAGARRALAHGSCGFAQQGHGFVAVESVQ
jgi:acetyl-CoA acetyltransferase